MRQMKGEKDWNVAQLLSSAMGDADRFPVIYLLPRSRGDKDKKIKHFI